MCSSRPLIVSLLGLVLSAPGCAPPPPEAPADLGELSLYLFSHFEGADEGSMEAGLVNLSAFLEELSWEEFELGSSREGREWAPPLLPVGELEDIPSIDGVDPSDLLAVSVASLSLHTPLERGPVVVMEDQLPVETSSSASYQRTILGDAACFLEQSCRYLRTHNTVHRDHLILDVVYEAYKDFQWVTLEGHDEPALVGRSWTEERFVGDSGINSIDQNYSLEISLPHADGALGYIAVWSQMTIPAITDEDLLSRLTADGIDELFVATESYLDAP